ncbi:class I SAM-dependent methyltransferase [Actinomadura atramentaria]|uniref:class I SAM-dependent methyltransferase n=1 Tax=Actinomadura atramentaria TaxID=1990 RepID=UPI00036E5952|nr:class I SAM-dependent methyltransferase [Actinomadura atramentaria]
MESADWDARYAGTELVWTAEANRFVVEEAGDLTPGRALDLAAGEGRNAVWLAERGWSVTAVDFSPNGLAKARRLAESRGAEVDWVLADVRDHRPEPRAFDLVLVAYLHLPQPDLHGVLERAAAAVAPGGTLLVVGHDRANIGGGVGGPRDPAVLYDAPEVVAALGDLRIVRAGRVEREVPGEGVALDTLVRAAR